MLGYRRVSALSFWPLLKAWSSGRAAMPEAVTLEPLQACSLAEVAMHLREFQAMQPTETCRAASRYSSR
jgi:hypothetical protein